MRNFRRAKIPIRSRTCVQNVQNIPTKSRGYVSGIVVTVTGSKTYHSGIAPWMWSIVEKAYTVGLVVYIGIGIDIFLKYPDGFCLLRSLNIMRHKRRNEIQVKIVFPLIIYCTGTLVKMYIRQTFMNKKINSTCNNNNNHTEN